MDHNIKPFGDTKFISPRDLNKLKKRSQQKRSIFLLQKHLSSCLPLQNYVLSLFPPPPQKKNSKTHRGGFSLSRLCGKLHIPKNPLGQFVFLGSFLQPFFGGGKVFCGVIMISENTFLEWFVERLFLSKYVSNQRCPRVQNHSATWVAKRGVSRGVARNCRCCDEWEVSEGLAGV